MFFDDFEPLEDIEPSKTKNDPPPRTQKAQNSPAKEQKSFGVDMDDFAEFQAGARDHDDDQSSVYTEDYMGGFGANDSVNRSGEDLDDEGDEYEDTWKNNTVNLAKSSTKEPTGQKKEEQILNDFYGGAQAGFLFDNYVLDDNQRRMEEPSPIYVTSARLSDKSGNSFGMREDKEEHRMTPESKEQLQYLEQEPPARPTAEFKQAQSVEIEQPVASKSGFGSSDFGQEVSEQQIESKGTVDFHHEEEEVVEEPVHVQEKVPEKSQEQPNPTEEFEGMDQFEDADNFQGVQVADFESFVENDDNYSQDDSKYEGSFISEKDFSQPNSARPESQVRGGSKILEELEPYQENHQDESQPYMNQPSYGSSSEVPKSQKTIESNSDIFDLKAERTPQNVQNEIVHHQHQPVDNAWDNQPEIESATSERMQNIPPSSASVEQKESSPHSVENYPNYFDDEKSSQPTPQHQNKQLVDELENNFDFIPGRPAIKRSSTQEIKSPQVEKQQPLSRHQSTIVPKQVEQPKKEVQPEPILEVKNFKPQEPTTKTREPLFKRPSLEKKPSVETQPQIKTQPEPEPQQQSKPIQKEPPPQVSKPIQKEPPQSKPIQKEPPVVPSPTSDLQRSQSMMTNSQAQNYQDNNNNMMRSSQRNTLGFSRPGAESATATIENSTQRFKDIRSAETKKPYPNLQDSAVNTDISRDFDNIEPRELKKPKPEPEQRTPVKKPIVLTHEAVKQVVYTPVEKKEKKQEEPPVVVQTREVFEIGQQKKSTARPPESPKQIKSTNTIITPIQSKGTTPRGGFAVQIKCASHPSEYIEKICVDPKYHGKKLLCFECGVEESREMQKYKVTTQPITQFLIDKIQQYQETDPNVSVPEEYLYTLRKLQGTEERLSANISDDITNIKKSLHDIKSDLLAKFDEIENTLDELSQYKLAKFSANREFFEKTLNNQYTSSSSGSTQKIPHQDLVLQVSSIETEADFDNFLRTLKLEKNPDSPEVKNYLKILSHKANNLSNTTKFPNKSLFKDLKSKNVNISQLQEQLVINLTSVKTTIYELLDSNYSVEDISKTRVMPSNTLTADNSNILFPLNRIADGSVRYRLNLDKKFVEPESKIITCMTIIDNEILAAGTAQKSITFWSLANAELLESIQAHDSSVSGLYPFKASLPDLRDRKPHPTMFKEDTVTLLISTGAQEAPILFWDISWMHDYLHGRITEKQQSRLIRKLEGHKNGVTAMLPLSDGVTLVNGTSDGRICVWNVLKNKLGGKISQHKEMITSLKILRCEQRFASASSDQTICIWKMAYKQLADPERRTKESRKIFAGFELEKILDPGFKILCLGSSLLNKNWLAFGGSIDRLVIWDIETGQLVKEFECDNNELVDLCWVEDESSQKMILFGVCNQDDVIRAWDTDYKHTNYLLDEVYNLKHRQNIYINKTSTNGSVLQLVQDGIVKIAAVNSEKNKSCVSLWEVELGI